MIMGIEEMDGDGWGLGAKKGAQGVVMMYEHNPLF